MFEMTLYQTFFMRIISQKIISSSLKTKYKFQYIFSSS